MDISNFKKQLEDVVVFLRGEFAQIRTGHASVELVENIKVDAYGTAMELKGLANISVADVRGLVVEPWDKSLLENIAKAISTSELGLLASIDGNVVRVKIPDLTEERRRAYAKLVGEKTEQARISIRQIRQKFMKDIEESVKNGVSEDVGKRLKEEAERLVKDFNKQLEELKEHKIEDLMTV